MDEGSATLVRLELETRPYHAAADAVWCDLMSPGVSSDRYVEQLIRVYGFEGPLEAALAYTPNLDLVLDVHTRFRAGYAAQDLLALGLRPSEVARLPQCVLAPFSNPVEALAWMYVSERATRLHGEVRRFLGERIPHIEDACVYLAASDGVVGRRWREFGRILDRTVRTPRLAEEVTTAAHAAFRCWIDWWAPEHALRRSS